MENIMTTPPTQSSEERFAALWNVIVQGFGHDANFSGSIQDVRQLLQEAFGYQDDYYLPQIEELKTKLRDKEECRRKEQSEFSKQAERLRGELREWRETFALFDDAQARAIAEWRKQDPEGRKLKLPDMRDLSIWLMYELTSLKQAIERKQEQVMTLRVALKHYADKSAWHWNLKAWEYNGPNSAHFKGCNQSPNYYPDQEAVSLECGKVALAALSGTEEAKGEAK